MLILVCGGDCTGKTTLCNNLSDKLPNVIYHHFDKPASMEDAKNEYYSYIDNLNIDNNYILDRMYDGEYVYAPIYRNYTIDYGPEIEQKLMNIHGLMPLLVYVTAEIDDIINRANTRGEDFVALSDHIKIKDLYNQFMVKQRLPYIVVNTSKLNEEQVVNKILEGINTYQKLCAQFYNGYWNWGNILDYKYVFINPTKYLGVRKPQKYMIELPDKIYYHSLFVGLDAIPYVFDKAEYVIINQTYKNLVPASTKVITPDEFIDYYRRRE